MPLSTEARPGVTALDAPAVVTYVPLLRAEHPPHIHELHEARELVMYLESLVPIAQLTKKQLQTDAALRSELGVLSELHTQLVTELLDSTENPDDKILLAICTFAIELKHHAQQVAYTRHFRSVIESTRAVSNPAQEADRLHLIVSLLDLPMIALSNTTAGSMLSFFSKKKKPQPLTTAHFIFDHTVPNGFNRLLELQSPPEIQELCSLYPELTMRYSYLGSLARSVLAVTPDIEPFKSRIVQQLLRWQLPGFPPIGFEELK